MRVLCFLFGRGQGGEGGGDGGRGMGGGKKQIEIMYFF